MPLPVCLQTSTAWDMQVPGLQESVALGKPPSSWLKQRAVARALVFPLTALGSPQPYSPARSSATATELSAPSLLAAGMPATLRYSAGVGGDAAGVAAALGPQGYGTSSTHCHQVQNSPVLGQQQQALCDGPLDIVGQLRVVELRLATARKAALGMLPEGLSLPCAEPLSSSPRRGGSFGVAMQQGCYASGPQTGNRLLRAPLLPPLPPLLPLSDQVRHSVSHEPISQSILYAVPFSFCLFLHVLHQNQEHNVYTCADSVSQQNAKG